jgi:ATP-dependent Clp protease ATP-binding subunit ClpA
MKNLSRGTEEVISDAMKDALSKNQLYCTTEHILIALLKNSAVAKIVKMFEDPGEGLGVEMARQLTEYLENHLDKNRTSQAVPPKLTCEDLFKIAINQVRSSNRSQVLPLDLFVAVYKVPDSWAKFVLEKNGMDEESVVAAVVNSPVETATEEETKEKDYLINLNEKAKAGKIDGLIGRDHEIERIIQVLCRRRKNNAILVGDPGVGKTAIAEGLALKIVEKNVPNKLKSAVVFSLDMSLIMAGTKYRGDFEAKMKDLISILKKTPNSILFIDEIHTIIGAGATGGGSLDTANILKPILTTGEIKCIGSTTYKEYNNIFEKDAALSRRFQKVDVVEPSIEDTIKILHGLKSALESHHEVTYTVASLRAATELSVKHINDRLLPDKAIDILDEAGSMTHLKGLTRVDISVIEKTIAKIARIPEKSVTTEEKNKLEGLLGSLKTKIFGQDEALDSVVSAIELSSSGLRSGEKPVGSFLFCGPTGVGKTEVCKQLSSFMGVPLIRFDMSEYMEKHTVSKLIGAPPGYVGYDQNGLLTDAVRKNPHAIILLDEIEKAHPDVWNLLLQVMDHGSLTDNNGKLANFKHAIVVMTSNVGAADLSKRSIGFAESKNKSSNKPTAAVETMFSPEFRNRLDAIVYFNQLSQENIGDVFNKNLVELENQLSVKKVVIHCSQEVKAWFIKNGYDPKMGARPMARLVQDKIKKPLSSEILYGKLQFGGEVIVSIEEGNLKFNYKSKLKSKSKVSESTEE